MSNALSIIIPILNERETIGKLLHHLNHNSYYKNHQIIVVDGGSTDNSEQEVKRFGNVCFIESQKGRACQMNTGAQKAEHQLLYFLHGDSLPPKTYDQIILQSVGQGTRAGCFRLKFDSNHFLLTFSAWFTRFNWIWCRGGDQSLFITKELFVRLNGFDEEYKVYEDCELLTRLYRIDKFKVLPATILTSARKYRQLGYWKLQYHFAVIHLKNAFGADPDDLMAYYKKHIG